MIADKECWRCGHNKGEHGRLDRLVRDVDTKIEVCLSCNGWVEYDNPRRGSPARHRFVEPHAT